MSLEAKVGAFVVICLMLLATTIYYVGTGHLGKHFTPYKTYLRYAGGVAPGTNVLFGGIEAGSVVSVSPSREDPTRIEIDLQVKQGTPVNEKSVAKLGSVTLMSSPAIEITTGSNNARRLQSGEVIQSLETVSMDDMTRKLATIADGANGLIAEVRTEIANISGKAQTVLGNLNEITGPVNRRQISQLLRQVNSMVSTESPKIDEITSNLARVTRDADSVVQKVGPLVDHTDATVTNVNHTIDQLREPIREDLVRLQAVMDQANSTMKSIQTLVRANDQNITETVENVRVATENLDDLTNQLKQRPWSLVRIRQEKDREVPK
ncbi:MAG: MCE family protein [Blastocatellia bacterium]|nr:MCE family protein [Blastocatellia bacterium]